MKGFLGLTLLPLLAAASPTWTESIHNGAAPILSSTTAKEIPDSYIVVFKKHVGASAAASHHSWVQDIHTDNVRMELKKRSLFGFDNDPYLGLKHTFHVAGSLMGYAGHFHEDVIEQVRRHPDVSCYYLSSLHFGPQSPYLPDKSFPS
jgi:cerevisin